MNLFSDLNETFGVIITISIIAAAIAYVWTTIKNSKGKADTDTIATYKSEVDALKLRADRFEETNKDLIRQVGILTGENKTLKEVLALRDPKFEEAFFLLSNSLKDMRDDLRTHYDDDKKNFAAIKDGDNRKMKVMEAILNNQVKEIIPKINKNG